MPDITMCAGKAKIEGTGSIRVCIQRQDCYRFRAEPHPYRQSYFVGIPVVFVEIPVVFVDGKATDAGGAVVKQQQCEHFYPFGAKAK